MTSQDHCHSQLACITGFGFLLRLCHRLGWALFLALFVTLWLRPPLAHAVDPAFNTSKAFGPSDSDTRSVAVGDLNGDGYLDLVVGNVGQQNVAYLNDGQGNFLTAINFGSGNDATQSVAVADLDGDGDLDLIAGNDGQQNVVYLNDGQANLPTFSTAINFGSGSDATQSVAVGNLNGDGYLDLAVGNYQQQNVVYLNDGQADFSTTANFGSGNDRTRSVAVGDLNGDGDLDLVVGNQVEQNVVYLNDGQADLPTFSTPINFGTAVGGTESVAVGDLDGDGDLDLVVGNSVTLPPLDNRIGQDAVYLNDGQPDLPTFSTAVNLGSNTESSLSLAVGDINGDSHLDLVVGRTFNNVVYLNNGQADFSTTISFGLSRVESVAIGDFDADGDLDLVAGNVGQNVAHLNDGQADFSTISTTIDFGPDDDFPWSMAVGDLDGDSDLDLAVGNYQQQNLVYLNDGQTAPLTFSTTIDFGPDDDPTQSVAVGDLNGDGHLDLVVGNNGEQNVVYLNDGQANLPTFSTAINFGPGDDLTSDVAVGDLNGDGHLDLIVGNNGDQNVIYLNDGQANLPTFSTAINFGPGDDLTSDVAVGDLNGDGHLDLVAGNTGQPNVVYLNDGQADFPAFSTAINFGLGFDTTSSVAVGDLNGDGHLDLVAGNIGQPNVVYLNDGQADFPTAINFGSGNDLTFSIAVGDVNGDRHLDLVVGNLGQPNVVYLNGGQADLPTFSTAINFRPDFAATLSVAVGDLNEDGRLDLVVGNRGANVVGSIRRQNVVYLNGAQLARGMLDHPPAVTISRPVTTPRANFYASPVILKQQTIPVTYTLFDPESDPVRFIRAYYSPTGGGQWFPATPLTPTQMISLSASPWPTGTTYTFLWNAEDDVIESDNIVFRIEAYQGFTGPGPYQWPYASAQTFPFRVQAGLWYAKVVSGTQPIAGAAVYQAGQLITKTSGASFLTNQAGLIGLDNPTPGQPLVAIWQAQEQPTARAAHDGWAYRTYLTSLNLDEQGDPHPDTVGEQGEQRITIRPTDPLVLFNIVVSVEWDATNEYLMALEDAFKKASGYLYDVTDGQMAFGQVAIYDNALFWAEADFQFSTKNTVRPYAFVGGITSGDIARAVRVGRFWDGGSGSQGPWNEPEGYRTLIHEFGHYALFLYDAYFIRLVDNNGNFLGQRDATCTSNAIKDNGSDPTNATMMYYQYNASELSDLDENWDQPCQDTEQFRLNQESDWQTVVRHYRGPGWVINTPGSRSSLMAGPAAFPTALLPFPTMTIFNTGLADAASVQVTVRDPQTQPVRNALVALYTQDKDGVNIAIDQGLTGQNGGLAIYGARPNDTIKAATFNGALAGGVQVSSGVSNFQLNLNPTNISGLAIQAGPATPYLNVIPGSDGDTLNLSVQGALPGTLPLNAVVVPGEGAGTPQLAPLAYSSGTESYNGGVGFAGVGLGTGRIQVSGLAGGQVVAINSDYSLQAVGTITANHLYSEDGNFELLIPAGGLPAAGYSTVIPTGHVPAPLPEGKQVIGSAYEVRISGALIELEKDGLVRLHYHPQVTGVFTKTAIYYWDAAGKNWINQGGDQGEVDNALATTATRLGIYVLMGETVTGNNRSYLPVIWKE